jgi:hypothetical protein
MPFRVHWLESLIDQLLYISNFADPVPDPLVPPCEHFIDIVSDYLSDFNSGNIIYSEIVHTNTNHVSYDNDDYVDTISRIVHTNSNHGNVDNAIIDSRIVLTKFCNNCNGDNVLYHSGIVHTNNMHVSSHNDDNVVAVSGIVYTKSYHML